MAAGVVSDRALLVRGQLVGGAQHVLHGRVGPLGSLERLVGVVYVGLVVLVVMELHRLDVEGRLERVVVVRQRGDGERHCLLSSRYECGRGKDMLRALDRKSTRLNSSHLVNSYAVFC